MTLLAASLLGLLHAIKPHSASRERKYLRAAEQELRTSKERFERALEGASCGLWEWNFAAEEVWLSPRFKELLGYTDQELPNTLPSWEAALHPEDRNLAFDALNAHVCGTDAYDVEYRLRTKSGVYRWFHARGLAIRDPSARPYLLSGSIQDIHDRKQAEEAVRQRDEYLRQKQKMEAVGELAGGLAHEFNNLLQAISGCIQFARRVMSDNSEGKKDLDTASTLIKQAAQLTRQLLDFSRCKPTCMQPIDPKQLLDDLSTVLRTMLPETIDLDVCADQQAWPVLADSTLLQQVLMNLCINAKDAMPDGGLLAVHARNVELLGNGSTQYPDVAAGRYVAFTVSDNGCGMTADLQARIFEPFFTTKDVGEGTGLGLAIAYGVVKEHHGAVQVKSEIGCGSSFIVLIPVAEKSMLVNPQPTSDSVGPNSTNGAADSRTELITA